MDYKIRSTDKLDSIWVEGVKRLEGTADFVEKALSHPVVFAGAFIGDLMVGKRLMTLIKEGFPFLEKRKAFFIFFLLFSHSV